MIAIRSFGRALAAILVGATAAHAASFGDLSAGGPDSPDMGPGAYPPGPYAAAPYAAAPVYGPGPYAPTPVSGACPGCSYTPPAAGGAEGALPPPLDAPGGATMPPMPGSPAAYLPYGPAGSLPHGGLQLETFGQVNSTTDPFNPRGLSTPFMFVPWSTPLSGWTNAQTWNWWRERSGALPRNW